MRKDTFLHEFKGSSFSIDQHWISSKPPKIINWETEEEIKFKDINDLYENAEINGRPLKSIVEESEIGDLFGATLDDSDLQLLTPEEAEKYLIV